MRINSIKKGAVAPLKIVGKKDPTGVAAIYGLESLSQRVRLSHKQK
jgi:hypothetical protein